jgi:hypothetical protein
MKRLWGLAVGLALAGQTWAADPPETAPPPQTTAQVLAKLQKEVNDAQTKAFDPLQKAQQTEDEKEKKRLQAEFTPLYEAYLKLQEANQEKAAAIAKAEPKTETGLDAALWAAPGMRSQADRKALLDLVVEHHVTSKKMTGAIGLLSSQIGIDPKALDTLESIVTKSPHKSVQAAAVMAVADHYKNRAEPYGRKPPDDADELMKKAEVGYERVVKDYGTEVQYGNRTFGDAAKSVLYEVRNLRVGKSVPEIEGEDMDGAKFKISDYRGKVVMLDFWGHW